MNRQQAYNHIMKLLLKQGKFSTNMLGDCVYNGPDGTACAIGLWLRDRGVPLSRLADYESKSVDAILQGPLVSHFKLDGDAGKFDNAFWYTVQKVHDAAARMVTFDRAPVKDLIMRTAEVYMHSVDWKEPFNEVPKS